MAKNSVSKKPKKIEVEDDFDFAELIGSALTEPAYDDEIMAGVMHTMIEANNNQMKLAIELTRLAIEKSATKNMSEDDVFSVFRQATKIISEVSPLKSIMEKLEH